MSTIGGNPIIPLGLRLGRIEFSTPEEALYRAEALRRSRVVTIKRVAVCHQTLNNKK
jgi:hypothetical protein